MMKLEGMRENLNRVKYFFSKIEQHVPYIPDFADIWNIFKILVVSLFICIIYSFSQIEGASQFYIEFWKNIVKLSPYLLTQLILLVLFAPQIKKNKPSNAILLILLLNFFSVYGISSASDRSLEKFFINWDIAIAKFSVSFGLMFFFLIYFDWKEKNIHPSHVKAKLSFLQSKMHPHFLFNTLNSIMSLIKREPEKARKMLSNLAALLRASLKEDPNSIVGKMEDEIHLCKQYLEIEKMRLGDRLEISWTIDENVLYSQIPKLTIQPLIENSILHGIQNILEGGLIDIQIKTIKDKVSIYIINPKPLSTDSALDKDGHNNISLDNLSQRLNIYFDGNVSFKVKETKNLYSVEIIIPKIERANDLPFTF